MGLLPFFIHYIHTKILPLDNISIDIFVCYDILKHLRIDSTLKAILKLLLEPLTYRSADTVDDFYTLKNVIRLGLTPCIERMLSFTDHLRRLRVDRYEYVALKVIVLLTSGKFICHNCEN